VAFTCRLACASWLCGALVTCAVAPPPRPSQPNRTGSAAVERTASADFALVTESPQSVLELGDSDELTLRRACGESDAALIAVASRLVENRSGAELDAEAISYALRAAGAPYVWPRAWLFDGREGEVETAKLRMQRWLSGFSDGGVRRCGVTVRHENNSRMSVAAVAVDVLADLEALPTRARIGQWLEVRATLRVPASEAKLVVLGPRGAPRPVPTSFDAGRVRARFNADLPGAWVVQLLGSVDGGPRPLLEALLFAGSEPPATAATSKVPGEDAPDTAGDPRAALYAMVNAARASEHRAPLERDARLESLAQEHAEAMLRARKTAHDTGDGDLNRRLERAGLELSAGENVAHAGSATLAQRALWASPSHRENLLFRGFDAVGIGLASDADGTLWVCQVFASSH
jgi:cysteine-rich secretory family protein